MKKDIRHKLAIILMCTALLLPAAAVRPFAADEDGCSGDKKPSVDLSDVTEDNAASDELLVLAEKGTTKKEMSEIADDAGASLDNIGTLSDGSRLARVSIDDPEDMQETAEELAEEEKVLIVQPNYLYSLDESLPDDTSFSKQWYLYGTDAHKGGIDAVAAWSGLSGGSTVTVAVIDTGVQLDHPDLNNIITDKCVTFNDGKQGSFTAWDGSDDDHGHGTHVCGIISAETGNGEGIAGVSCNRAAVMVIDASKKETNRFSTQDIVLSIDYARKQGAKLINMSLGGIYRDYITEAAVNDAFDNGVLCICSAGNQSSKLPQNPGDARGAVSVMSHKSNGSQSDFSNYGSEKDVSAPGSDIYSTFIGSDYTSKNGTSMAAPVVTGIAAMLLSEDPALTPRQIKNFLYTSSGTGDYVSGKGKAGFGMVNASAAINDLKLPAEDPQEVVLNRKDISMHPEEKVFLEYAVYPAAAGRTAENTEYASSDDSVAAVDEYGQITAISPGEAVISVSCGEAEAECRVKVEGIQYEHINELPFIKEGVLSPSDPALKIQDGKYESYMDGYETDMNKGDVIGISMTSSTATPYIRVLDSKGKLKDSSYYSGKDKEKTISLSFTAAVTDRYRIQVLSYPNDDATEDKEYSLRVTHIHKMSKIDGVPAGCTQSGYETYYSCSSCGGLFSDSEGKTRISGIKILEPLGHNDIGIDKLSFPTCTEKGFGIYTCSRCGKHTEYFAEPLGHAVEKAAAKEADCTHDGNEEYWKCRRCGTCWSDPDGENEIEESSRKIPASHSMTPHPESAANCTEDGNTAYWSCSRCNKYFSDSNGKNEIEENRWVKAAKGHQWDKGSIISDPTCTDKGVMKKHCTECDAESTEEINALGHDLDLHKAKAATCTEAGSIEYWTCGRCKKYFSDKDGTHEIAKEDIITKNTGHSYGPWKIITPATEDNAGADMRKCLNCGDSQKRVTAMLPPSLKIKTQALKPKAAKTSITVRWKKTSEKNLKKITGYQIQYAATSDFRNAKLIKVSKKKTSKKISRLAGKTDYYVRIRVYRGSARGSWSSEKRIKTK